MSLQSDPTGDLAGDPPPEGGWAELSRATEELRRRPEPRAVRVAPDVLRQALQSSRRSLPVRARGDFGFVRVSDQVLVARLREQIDGLSEGAAVGRVYLRVDPDATLRTVTVELFVRYGEVILDSADRVRSAVAEVVVDLLGEPVEPIEVEVTHVHVSDVTVGSPHLVDPGEDAPRRDR